VLIKGKDIADHNIVVYGRTIKWEIRMKRLQKIIRTQGKAFLEERQGIKIMHLKGAPYERGYQHGALLTKEISETVTKGITGAAARIACAISTDISGGLNALAVGKQEEEPFIPPEFKEEMRGISDALAAAGSNVSFDDIVLWNTMYDSYCFYNHPDPSNPATVANRHPYPPGCSSFSAWGRATRDGKLVFGKNMDNLTLPGILENRILTIIDPEHGFGHAFVTHPGMLAIDGGINEDGVEMMTHYSPSINETMRGCGIGVLTRLILQSVHRIDDAINILTVYPRCTGINYHVADAKVNRSAVIEVSASEVAVRYPEQGKDVLWSTNHSNCYPGWKGYNGHNMVSGQAKPFQLADITTLEKWQDSLRDRTNLYISGAGRFRRYEQLLYDNYGKITVEKGIEIVSDRRDPDSGRERGWSEAVPASNDGATICMLRPRVTYAENVICYKSKKKITISAESGCLWSLVAVPADGDLHLAITDFPAQRGPFVHLNLLEELER
jgi:hypothetical protein